MLQRDGQPRCSLRSGATGLIRRADEASAIRQHHHAHLRATQEYQYDALNRLRRVDNASLQRIDAWTYDGTGNRLSQQAGQGPVLNLSYPPTSHRVSVAGVARSDDANGNTTARDQ